MFDKLVVVTLLFAATVLAGCNTVKPSVKTVINPNPVATPYEKELASPRVSLRAPQAQHNYAVGNFDSDAKVEMITTRNDPIYQSIVFESATKPSKSKAKSLLRDNDWKDRITFSEVSPNSRPVRDSITILGGMEVCLHTAKMVVTDFNADGIDDILMACHGYDSDPWPGEKSYVLMSTAPGTFEPIKLTDKTGFYHGATALDVNNDGLIDPVVVAPDVGIVYFKNNGDGSFGPATSLKRAEYGMYNVKAVDLNNDGYPEILAYGHEKQFRTKILWNNGNGKFTKSTTLPRESGWGIVIDVHLFKNNLYVVRTRDGNNFYTGGMVQQVSLDTMKTVDTISHNGRHPATARVVASSNKSMTVKTMNDYRTSSDFVIDASGMRFINN